MNTEQIMDAIIAYFDNGEEDAQEIKNLLLLDHNQEVGLDFICEVISDYVYEEYEPSDEGFDAYMGTYTDDC